MNGLICHAKTIFHGPNNYGGSIPFHRGSTGKYFFRLTREMLRFAEVSILLRRGDLAHAVAIKAHVKIRRLGIGVVTGGGAGQRRAGGGVHAPRCPD